MSTAFFNCRQHGRDQAGCPWGSVVHVQDPVRAMDPTPALCKRERERGGHPGKRTRRCHKGNICELTSSLSYGIVPGCVMASASCCSFCCIGSCTKNETKMRTEASRQRKKSSALSVSLCPFLSRHSCTTAAHTAPTGNHDVVLEEEEQEVRRRRRRRGAQPARTQSQLTALPLRRFIRKEGAVSRCFRVPPPMLLVSDH